LEILQGVAADEVLDGSEQLSLQLLLVVPYLVVIRGVVIVVGLLVGEWMGQELIVNLPVDESFRGYILYRFMSY
jgi:hypothetical protein